MGDTLKQWEGVSNIWRALYEQAEKDVVGTVAGALAWQRLQSMRALVSGEVTLAHALASEAEKREAELSEKWEKLDKQLKQAVEAVNHATDNGYKRGVGVAKAELEHAHEVTLKEREVYRDLEAVRYVHKTQAERAEALEALLRRMDTIEKPAVPMADVVEVMAWLRGKK